ncbi:MAG: prepilin-type N-terminal cleavage/methylation domain-containing protein [Burkholderiales bacterium]|jgi:prepilin-type N-terminal cleavage/methylation domain-containing protein|nr:prepilin-type N-terminal cleavage/methylation domain-containing protein [Burkholderiales bacterium]
MKVETSIQGFTLIELMIVLALAALLLVMAAPGISVYLENTKIRNVAESIAAGMRQARLHAMAKSAPTEVVINRADGSWTIWQLDDTETPVKRVDPFVESFVWGAGGHNWKGVSVIVNPAAAVSADEIMVTFDQNTGRALRSNLATTATLSPPSPPNNITVTGSLAGTRRLQVDVRMTGGVRVCDPDPSFPSTDPKSCRFSPLP